ncbi:unnamed protein product [Kluyveromyces dobzhanskii CBS 2104]|uniref:WGS project CCBQ000000000 data, contig 00099 n=1 Tax=Kluyveromyces dobzhanskii CBS 2104 TaxID=1427455 RepID=A0A0A8L4F3_9SACH|nr:unnamed protein product [Kluyveromyces dobzhanskii CBS 2104]
MPSPEIERISQLLKDDVSVEGIRKIREGLIKQKSTVEYQLNKQSKARFQDAQSCLQLMTQAQRNMKSLKEDLRKVDGLSKENRSSIKRYDVINDATRLHELMENTLTIHQKIIQYNDFLNQLEMLLDHELSQDTLESGCPNLLKIHYMITTARDFHDQMTVLASISSSDVQTTMSKVFQRVPGCVEKFNRLLRDITYDIIEAVRTENQSLLIRLFKVIHLEECEDIKIVATRNIIKAQEIELESKRFRKISNKVSSLDIDHIKNLEYPTPMGIATEINKGTIQTRTLPRGYKNVFFTTIKKAIQEMFTEVRNEYSGDKKFEVLNNLDWVFNELIVVRDHVTPLGPAHWKLFDRYFEFYYDEVHKLITELVESEPETIVILDILDYDKNFQSVLKKDFGFTKDNIKSIIGDTEKEQLLSDYLTLILNKMREWIGNLEKTEIIIFTERSSPPHIDSDSWLFLDGTKTCFQMFNQQVEVAAGSGQAKILVGVVERFCNLLISRQEIWVKTINDQLEKCIDFNHRFEESPESFTKENGFPGGLVEYLVAVANDQMKAADYAVAISQKYGSYVSKVHERTITAQIEKTLDGFAYVAKCATSGICQLIFDDLRSPYAEIFDKSWYGGNQTQQIASTIQEYLNDIKDQMNPFIFFSLVETAVEETLLRYVQCLKYDHSIKNKGNKFLDCIRRDFKIFYQVFVEYVPAEEKVMIDDKFKFAEYFIDLCCDTLDTLLDSWKLCLDTYWDCPLSLLQHILKSRKDVDKSDMKRILAQAEVIQTNPQRIAQLKSIDVPATFICRF